MGGWAQPGRLWLVRGAASVAPVAGRGVVGAARCVWLTRWGWHRWRWRWRAGGAGVGRFLSTVRGRRHVVGAGVGGHRPRWAGFGPRLVSGRRCAARLGRLRSGRRPAHPCPPERRSGRGGPLSLGDPVGVAPVGWRWGAGGGGAGGAGVGRFLSTVRGRRHVVRGGVGGHWPRWAGFGPRLVSGRRCAARLGRLRSGRRAAHPARFLAFMVGVAPVALAVGRFLSTVRGRRHVVRGGVGGHRPKWAGFGPRLVSGRRCAARLGRLRSGRRAALLPARRLSRPPAPPPARRLSRPLAGSRAAGTPPAPPTAGPYLARWARRSRATIR